MNERVVVLVSLAIHWHHLAGQTIHPPLVGLMSCMIAVERVGCVDSEESDSPPKQPLAVYCFRDPNTVVIRQGAALSWVYLIWVDRVKKTVSLEESELTFSTPSCGQCRVRSQRALR